MNIKHPDGNQIIVMVNGTPVVTSTESFNNFEDGNGIWVSIGSIGGSSNMLIESDEWDAFVALIKETDDVVQGLKKEGVK